MSSDEKTLPLVTAIVLCYNQGRFVVEALESLRAQTYPNLHLVVIDDCSKDDSVEVIRNWLDRFWPSAVFLAHTANMGVCRTCNDGLAQAKGKYLRLIAADDRWVPGSLLRQVEVMEADPDDVGVLYSDAYRIDETGELLPRMFIESFRSFTVLPEGRIFDTLLEGNFIPAPTALVRRQCFETVGAFDEDLVFEDWDMWLRISRQFKFRYSPEPAAFYRTVQTSMSNTLSSEMNDSTRRMFIKCLRRGWLACEMKNRAVFLEYLGACEAYRNKFPSRFGEAAWAFRHRPCAKHGLLLSFVFLRLPYKWFERLVNALSNLSLRTKRLTANHAD